MAKWGDIRWWDTSAVITMADALSSHRNITGDYVMDENPKAAFFNTGSLPWDTSNVNNMQALLSDATAFNGDISAFNTRRVTDMSNVFGKAYAFNGKATIQLRDRTVPILLLK